MYQKFRKVKINFFNEAKYKNIIIFLYHFFSILVCIDIGVFQYIVLNLSTFLKMLNYIYKNNIKMRLNVIYLD